MIIWTLPFLVSLALVSCGGGNDPEGQQTVPDNIMTASAWEIGPVMQNDNMSQGMPLTPDVHPEGFSFDIPYPNREAGHAHYITVPTGPLTGKTQITLRARLEMAEGVKLVPVKFPDAVSLLTLYFQRGGDTWTAQGDYAGYRWYASFDTRKDLKPGEYVLTARFDQNWTGVQGGFSRTNTPEAFAAALAEASRIGFVLGGGDGLGHGVYATGPARLVVTDFKVE